MYSIKMLCYDPSNPVPYEDEPAYNPALSTKEEAYAKALQMAEEECEGLNDHPVDGVSFGVVEDQVKGLVHVLYYYLENEGDTTGNTETVTTYFVEEVKTPASVEVFGFTNTHADTNKKAQEIKMTSAVFSSKEEAEEAAWKAYSKEYSFAREYGLLQPTEERYRRPDFLKALWKGTSCIRRTDLQIRFGGWSQMLRIGG